MARDTRNKIPSVYLNDDTYQTLQRLSALMGMSINGLAKHYLEELQPILQETAKGLEAVQAGKSTDEVLKELLGNSFALVGEKIKKS